MKQIMLLVVLAWSCHATVLAQDFDTFTKKMKLLETEERAYIDTIFKIYKNDEVRSKPYQPKLEDVRARKLQFAREAINANRNDPRFVDVLNRYVFNFLSIDELARELELFGPEARTNPIWKSMKSYVTYKPLNAVGKKCIDFTVKGHDGQDIRLADVLKQHKLVLLDFWASWCGPCRRSMPHLKEIYAAYKDRGLEIFSVSLDDKAAAWEDAYKKEALPWTDGSNLLGWKDPIAEQYAIRGIPHKVLVDSEGTILGIGFYKEHELEDTIEQYLKSHQ